MRPPTRPGLAVAALVCGIVGIPLLFIAVLSLLAVIFGLISARQIKRSNGAMTGLGMARAGWILGVIGLIGFGVFVWAGATGRLDDEDGNGIFDRPSGPAAELGECLESVPTGSVVFSFDVIDCDEPHIGEVYLVDDLSDDVASDEYPGDVEMGQVVDDVCLDGFENFVGRSYQLSIYNAYFVYPREVNWELNDRDVVCIIIAPDPVTGTLEGVDE